MATYEYPKDITNHLYLKIQGFNYSMPELDGTTTKSKGITKEAQGKNKTTQGASVGTVNIYVPGGFGDSTTASWENQGVISLGDSNHSAAAELEKGNNSNFNNYAEALAKNIGAFTKSAAKAGLNSILDTSIGNVSIKSSFAANAGYTLAPNRMSVYEGNSNLSIPLNFEFAPKNSIELDNMLNIIDFFRKYSKGSINGVLLKFPPLFNLTVVNPKNASSVSNNSFFSYKAMAITSFGATYGNYTNAMSYFGNSNKFAPTDAKLSLTFTAITPDLHPGGTNLESK